MNPLDKLSAEEIDWLWRHRFLNRIQYTLNDYLLTERKLIPRERYGVIEGWSDPANG